MDHLESCMMSNYGLLEASVTDSEDKHSQVTEEVGSIWDAIGLLQKGIAGLKRVSQEVTGAIRDILPQVSRN